MNQHSNFIRGLPHPDGYIDEDNVSDYSDCSQIEPEPLNFFFERDLPDTMKKMMMSCYNDNYYSACLNGTVIHASTSLGFKQKLYCTENFTTEDLEDLFKHISYAIFSDYEDVEYEDEFGRDKITIENIPAIIVRLDQTYKNVYCVIRNMSMKVGCMSCDGATSCTFELIFASDWHTLFNFCLCESERQLFGYIDTIPENKQISLLCDLPLGVILSVKKPIYKFNYPTNVQFEFL